MADNEVAHDQPADRWYVAREGQPHGPVKWDDLLQLLQSGQVTPADFVWREGLEDWVPLGLLAGAATAPPAAPPSPPRPPMPAATPAHGTNRSGAAAPMSRRRAGRGWLLVAIVVSAMVVAGAVGWSLNSLSQAKRPTAEAAGDRAARQSHAAARAPASAESDHEMAIEPGRVDESVRDAPSRLEETRPRDATRQPVGPGPVTKTDDTPTLSPASGEIAKAGAPTDPAPKTGTAPAPAAPSPTDVKPPPETKSPPTPTKQPATEATQPPGSRLLYQEVLVARRPAFNVSGVTISQDLQYRVISKLYVGTRASDGTLDVKQVIYETKLEKSENLSRAAFEESLKAMRGQELRYTLGKDNEIVKFAGPRDTRKVVKADGLGGEGFLLSSVMDDDGWKELAQLSFFMPPSPLKRGERFERKLTHDWGAMGSWYGKTVYTPAGERSGEQRIDYAHYLYYKAPEKKAADLPFEITAATFKIEQAAGSIQWNPKTARMTNATERFVVRGTVTTQVLGQSIEAQVEESQAFSLRVMDKLPAETSGSDRAKR